MKRVPSHFKKSVFVLMVLGATTSAYANTPVPAPAGSSNDVGCPNTSTKTGVYAPCVGYIAPGSTSAVGVHYLSAIPGVVVNNSMTTGQAAAKGLLPKALGTPSFGVMVAVSEAGGAGQQNPTSQALTAQQYCGTGSNPPPGTEGWSYSANPQWSGWDNLNNPPQSYKGWNYSCQFTQQPTQACQYISRYDANGNPVWTNYTAYGAWSWGNGNNGTWSQPSCSTPNAPTPPAKPTCPSGQTQTAAATWNGSSWVGLTCSPPTPPDPEPTQPGVAVVTHVWTWPSIPVMTQKVTTPYYTQYGCKTIVWSRLDIAYPSMDLENDYSNQSTQISLGNHGYGGYVMIPPCSGLMIRDIN